MTKMSQEVKNTENMIWFKVVKLRNACPCSEVISASTNDFFSRFNAFPAAAVGIHAELDQESSLCSAKSQSLQKVG